MSLGQSGCTRAKWFLLGTSGCIRANWLYLEKSGSIRAKRFNSRKTGCNWLKLLYSCKSCSVRALVVFFGQK